MTVGSGTLNSTLIVWLENSRGERMTVWSGFNRSDQERIVTAWQQFLSD